MHTSDQTGRCRLNHSKGQPKHSKKNSGGVAAHRPANAPQARFPSDHIAAIHVLKSQLRLSDDDYRALLVNLTGKTSSKDCTLAQRDQVRKHMEHLAERMGVARPRRDDRRADQQRGYAQRARPLERKVWALWYALGRAGKLDSPTPAALQAWVRRQWCVDHVRFCSDEQLHSLIESLKLWGGR